MVPVILIAIIPHSHIQGGYRMKKRILSIILTLTMALCLLSASVLAAEPSFGISMGGTQLEPGKYYRADADGNAEETTPENYEIYFVSDDTNVYTLTINGAAEHEIAFGNATSLTVVDYSQSPTGNRVTYTPQDSDTVMVQTMDSNVADGTFVVLTAGKLNAALAPDQSLTLAYQNGDGSFTNARHFHASAGNNNEGEQYFAYFLLFGYPGIDDSITVSGGDSVTIDDILYTYHDYPTRAMTIHFSMDRSPYITADHFGKLTVRADRADTKVLNGYDFVAGYPTEAVFNVEQPKPCLLSGTIALDQGEVVIANTAYITGDNAVVSMDEITGIATVDGRAVVGGALEITGNPGDDDYRALAEVAPNGDITLCTGAATALGNCTVQLKSGGNLVMAEAAELAYSYDGNYIELQRGTIKSVGSALTVYVGTTALQPAGADTTFALTSDHYDPLLLSDLSGEVNAVMEEGTELTFSDGQQNKIIRAQSYVSDLTICDDGSILEGGEPVSDPDGDHVYLVGAAHTTYELGGFTIFGNPDGVSYDDETGVLSIHTSGSYTIQNTTSVTIGDAISVDAPGTVLTLKDIRIETDAAAALTVRAEEVTIYAESSNTLTGIGSSGIANYNSDPLHIYGDGTLAVTGNAYLAVEGSLYISGPSVTVTGADGIWGNVSMVSGALTVTGMTHAGIRGNVNLYGGNLTVTGGSGGNGEDGEPAIYGNVSLYGGSLTATGGKAATGSNGNGGTGVTGSVYVQDGIAALTGGAGSGTGSNGNGISDEENLSGNTDRVTVAEGKPDRVTGAEGKPDSSPVVIRYKVTADAENGTINIGTRYRGSETVTFTVTPDAGYVLKSLTVTRKSGAEVAFTEKDGIYTFKMPASAVTVKAEFALTFEDIESDHPFYEAIEWAFRNNLMNGMSETTFDRINPITRQQVWRVLARLVTKEDPADMSVAKDWAVAQGITDGTNPGTAATREEFVTMLWTAYGKPAADTSALTAFSDADAISADAIAAMAWAVEQGIVGGYEDGTLRPAAGASRGAFAAILFRYLAK